MLKDKRVGLRIAPAEVEALKTLAAHERRSMSEIIRELIRNASKERGLWSPGKPANGARSEAIHAASRN